MAGVRSGQLVALFTTSTCSPASQIAGTLLSNSFSGTSISLSPGSDLTDGIYSIYAGITDEAGNSACSGPTVFASYQLDTTGPVATDPHWAQTPPVHQGTLDLLWTKSSDPDLADQSVEIFSGAGCLDSPTWTFSSLGVVTQTVSMSPPQWQLYSFRVVSTDTLGNLGRSLCTTDAIQVEELAGSISASFEDSRHQNDSDPLRNPFHSVDDFRWTFTITPAVPAGLVSSSILRQNCSGSDCAQGVGFEITPLNPDQDQNASSYRVRVSSLTRPGNITPNLHASGLSSLYTTYPDLDFDPIRYEGPLEIQGFGMPHTYSCTCSPDQDFGNRDAGGSLSAPYEICRDQDWESLRNFPGRNGNADRVHFVLCRDFDYSLQGEPNFPPIPGEFTGSFDGNGFVIRGAHFLGGRDSGLFEILREAEIKSLSILDSSTEEGSERAGLIAGTVTGKFGRTRIQSVRGSGRVWGQTDAGGLLGRVEPEPLYEELNLLTLEKSAFHGFVRGEMDAGGLIGRSLGATTLDQTASTGSVLAQSGPSGGLIGTSSQSLRVSRSYSTAEITAPNSAAGGLIGHLKPSGGNTPEGSTPEIYDSAYFGGSISGSVAGGVIGVVDRGFRIARSYSAASSIQGSPDSDPLFGNRALLDESQKSSQQVAYWFDEPDLQGVTPSWNGNPFPLNYPSGISEEGVHRSQLTDPRYLSKVLQFDFHQNWEMTDLPGLARPRITFDPEELITLPHPYTCLCDPHAANPQGYTGSPGTESDPYQICSIEQLQALPDFDKTETHFVQCEDLSFQGALTADPIASDPDHPFRATYDGNGYRIQDYILNSGSQGMGIFGNLEQATIKNLLIENSHLRAAGPAGLLASEAKSTRLFNVHVQNGSTLELAGGQNGGMFLGNVLDTSLDLCSAAGRIRGEGSIGGLIGAGPASIKHSWTHDLEVAVGSGAAGGLIGDAKSGSFVDQSYSSANVRNEISGPAGGLAGTGGSFQIQNSAFVFGTVSSNNAAGGLVGKSGAEVTLQHSYSASSILTSERGPDWAHPIIGTYRDMAEMNPSPLTLTGSVFWQSGENRNGVIPVLNQSSFYPAGGAGVNFTGVSFTELSSQRFWEVAVQYDFENTWAMDPVLGVPLPAIDLTAPSDPAPLKTRHSFLCACDPSLDRGDGTARGSDGSPNQICGLRQLNFLRTHPTEHFVLCSDQDLKKSSWIPIESFSGTLNGNGYTIRNFVVDDQSSVQVGFFYSLTHAVIQNLTLQGGRIHRGYAAKTTGGLAGSADHVLVKNTVIRDFEIEGQDHTGGFFGFMRDSRIENSEVQSSTITGKNQTGGLAGNGIDSVILQSSSDAEVYGNQEVGGLIGSGRHIRISKSIASGEVYGNSQLGGLVGFTGDRTRIEDSAYSGGMVSGSGVRVGGLIGSVSGSTTLTRSYSSAQIIHGQDPSGPLVGDFMASMEAGLLTLDRVYYWLGDALHPLDLPTASEGEVGLGLSTSQLQDPDLFLQAGTEVGSIWVGSNDGLHFPTPAMAGSTALPASSRSPYVAPTALLARAYHAQVTLNDGRILVIGGSDVKAPDRILSSVQVYDPTTKIWTNQDSLPTARHHHQAVVLPDGSVLVVGGLTADGSTRTTAIFNPAIPPGQGPGGGPSQWSAGPDLSAPRGPGFTLTAIPHGPNQGASVPDFRILVSGGQNEEGILETSELYSFGQNSFIHSFDSVPRVNGSAVFLPSGFVLVAGGLNQDRTRSDSVLFDAFAGDRPCTTCEEHAPGAVPVSPSWWSGLREVSTPVSSSAAIFWSNPAEAQPDGPYGKVFLIGGFDSSSNATRAVQSYDVASNSWTLLNEFPIQSSDPLAGAGLALNSASQILIFGGKTDSPSSGTFLWDPATGDLSELTGLPLGLSGSGASISGNSLILTGGVLNTGGTLYTGGTASSYLGTVNLAQGASTWIHAPSVTASPSPASGLSLIHSFRNTNPFAAPIGVTASASRTLKYGVTRDGGSFGGGSIFLLREDGTFETLYSFDGLRGHSPSGPLVSMPDGLYYGTTAGGGASDSGTLYSFNPTTHQVILLYSFVRNSSVGAKPNGNLIASGDEIYLATGNGGARDGYGSLSSYSTTTRRMRVLHSFDQWVEGGAPVGSFALNGQVLYGVLSRWGAYDRGAIYSFTINTNTFEVIHSFTGGSDGRYPESISVLGDAIYGTAQGGLYGAGVAYRCSAAGAHVCMTLHDFGGPAGAPFSPSGNLVYLSEFDRFYGTTLEGGASGDGTLFTLSPSGAFSTVYHFDHGSGGATPGGSILAADGLLYGATSTGGSGIGALYRFNPSDHTLSWSGGEVLPQEGYSPVAGMVQSGNKLYGVTQKGGDSGSGVLYSVDAGTHETTVIHSFTADEGSQPRGGLTLIGNSLYGALQSNGQNGGGAIFQWNLENSSLSILHSFSPGESVGYTPIGALVSDSSGSTLYGMTESGGNCGGGYGTLFQLTLNAGSIQPLHSFCGHGGGDGQNPNSLILSNDGSTLYGTTQYGGVYRGGVVFQYRLYANTGNDYSLLHGFDDGSNGEFQMRGKGPRGRLIQLGNRLIGTTQSGGNYGSGLIYGIEIDSGTFKKLYDFDPESNSRVSVPESGLTLSRGTLYGAFASGLYQFNPNTGAVSLLQTFAGSSPIGNGTLGELFLGSDGAFYGVNETSPDHGGTLFRYAPNF